MNLTTTNREFLRNYKNFKAKLLHGDVSEVLIPQSGDVVLRVSIEKKKTSFQLLTEKIDKRPLEITRPEEDII